MSNMSNTIKEFILDRKNNKIEILLKTKFLKDKDKGVNQYLINTINKDNNELKEIIRVKKEKEQSLSSFQKEKYNKLILLIQKLGIDVLDIVTQYQDKLQKLNENHIIEKWLDDNCKNANKISIATHIAKLTHSSNKGTCFYDDINYLDNKYLTTSQIKNIIVDASYENALYAPIASLLLVKNDEKYLYKMIIDGDFSAFSKLSKDNNQLNNWIENLKQAFNKDLKSSDSLSKQFYFPVKGKNYHLLSLLMSSSLMQALFEKVNKKSDYTLEIKEKYSTNELISYPCKAILSLTKSSHQNSSMLNGRRNGRLFLFSSQPPAWQSKLKPPISKKSMFDNYHYSTNTLDNIKYLVEFLTHNEDIDLSIRSPKKQEWLEKWTASIIDDFLFFVGNIHNLTPDWSTKKGVKLKIEHQYLLDPYREDKEFQANRKDSDWQTVVVSDFSTWLNNQLKNKDKKFTSQKEYSRTWKKVMKKELREYNQIIEVNINMEVSI